MNPHEIHAAYAAGSITNAEREDLLSRYYYALYAPDTQPTHGDTTMEPRTILSNLDNGTITQDAAIDLLIQHADKAYLIGAYLETRIQRTVLRQKYWAALDAQDGDHLTLHRSTDLIDHAFLTDHLDAPEATRLLLGAGMHADAAHHHVDTLQAEKTRSAERENYLEHPHLAPRHCTRCGIHTKAKNLSNRALCIECSTSAVERNLIALETKTGPEYEHWRECMLAYAYTLEDEAIAEQRASDRPELGNLPDPFHALAGIPTLPD